jgi:hypothetical protein
LPREQVKVIDDFFEQRLKAGHVRELTSPHCSPTFCVKKATGGWRIVHAFNKLNAATIPAQTPIPRKEVIIDGMQGSTIFSTIDLTDGFYQILMRVKDIPFTAVSTPSGMLWEWLVMPQGLSNAPATFNRCITHLLRPVRDFAPSYFDDVYIHSRAMNGKTDMDNHRIHVRKVLTILREHKIYARLQKCIFAAEEIPVLGCFVGKNGVRPDPEKIKAISEWPTPLTVKDLRKFLGLATYLHKYSSGYARLCIPLSNLLKKDVEWSWTVEHQQSFDQIKQSLICAPVLAIANHDKPFWVLCDASDFAIGSALMQTGILVFVDRFSKMVHLTAVPSNITAERSAEVFVDTVFRLHGMPSELISDRDIRFTATFWQHVFSILGTRLRMSTADHPQTDGQTERANRILEEILRCYVHSNPSSWSKHLSMAEFAMNNSVHASTTHTPFYVNGLRHPRLPPLLGGEPPLSGGGIIADDERLSKSSTETDTLSQHHSSELRMAQDPYKEGSKTVKQCNLLDKTYWINPIS